MIYEAPTNHPVDNRPLTREEVVWAYRIMLGREPESETAIHNALSHKTREHLLQTIMKSVEFRAWHASQPGRQPLDRPKLDIEWEAGEATLPQLLEHVSSTWSSLGAERPHWSVLTMDQFLPENIDGSEDAFYGSGKGDFDRMIATLERLDRSPDEFQTLFEYGCGLGRTTLHLASRFASVVACDISSRHLELARAKAQQCGVANVLFREARLPDFGMLEPVDLWFCQIVLQHNSPPIIAMILGRAMQVLKPGGVAYFQVPTYSPGYRFRVAEYLAHLPSSGMEMHVLPQRVIFEIALRAGCVPLEVSEDDATGSPLWLSNTFVFAKPKQATRGRRETDSPVRDWLRRVLK